MTTPFVLLQSGNHGRICAAGAMEPLVQLAAGGRRRYVLLRDDGTIDVDGMSDPLRELRLDEEMIRLLGYDVDCRRYGNPQIGDTVDRAQRGPKRVACVHIYVN